MNNKIKKIVAMSMTALTLITTALPVSAREIASFSNFKVTYSGAEKFAPSCIKAVTGTNGVVNLSNDTGSAWITANMKNMDGEYRGGTNVQRGKRKEFKNKGAAGFYYKLGLRKTNNTGTNGAVTIKGSWSPDNQ